MKLNKSLGMCLKKISNNALMELQEIDYEKEIRINTYSGTIIRNIVQSIVIDDKRKINVMFD